jgi:hypothetical protein
LGTFKLVFDMVHDMFVYRITACFTVCFGPDQHGDRAPKMKHVDIDGTEYGFHDMFRDTFVYLSPDFDGFTI